MIDIIRKSNKEIQKENITNIEIRSLFTTINKNEMLDELEKQIQQILKLIKQNEIKEKQILNLTQEKEALYSVDKILKKKNLKFSKLTKMAIIILKQKMIIYYSKPQWKIKTL